MNIYTGSNDVLYWLYSSQQISTEKTGIFSEFLVFLLFGEVYTFDFASSLTLI